jgi:plastocyanin
MTQANCMQKKVLAAPPIIIAIIALAAVLMGAEDSTESAPSASEPNLVSITMSSSRPGCEAADACFVPHEMTVNRGESVVWANDDSAFHTVTSGFYDESDGVFDSNQLDPSQKFSHMFSEPGQFQYYCKLHPWMEGKVIVN